MKKIILILSMLLILISGCTNGETTEEATTETQPKIENNAQNQEPQSKSIEVMLNSVETTKEDKFDELKEGIELLVVDISITNTGKEIYEFNPNYLELKINDKTLRETYMTPKDKDAMSMMDIEPGQIKTGIICFEIEEGITDYGLVYEDFDNNKIVLK